MAQWKYTTRRNCTDRDLAALGDAGWELVAVATVGWLRQERLFYFKSPKLY